MPSVSFRIHLKLQEIFELFRLFSVEILTVVQNFGQISEISSIVRQESVAPRRVDRPYQDLGNLLEKWRISKFRSARSMFQESKISTSYSAYVDYERGALLPTVEVLLELTAFFSKNPEEALLLWAQVQMPTPESKRIFDRRRSGREGSSRPLETEKSDSPPSFENTWVFGAGERAVLNKNPWLWELCLSLAMIYPDELLFESWVPSAQVRSVSTLKKILSPWIESGAILVSQTGMKLRHKHLHIPNTSEWKKIRQKNIERAVAALLSSITPESLARGDSFRELVHRPLTPRQAKKWAKKLKAFDTELRSDQYVNPETEGLSLDEDLTHALVLILGKRDLRK